LIILSKQIVRGEPRFHLANNGRQELVWFIYIYIYIYICIWNRSHEHAVCFIFWNL